MTESWAERVREVEARAGQRCEYCRMHQALQGATFHVEHIMPIFAGGSDEPANLAWACPSCNLKKSNRQTATDPETAKAVARFHPRTARWEDHFAWNEDGTFILGLSPAGPATVEALHLNRKGLVNLRRILFAASRGFGSGCSAVSAAALGRHRQIRREGGRSHGLRHQLRGRSTGHLGRIP